MLPSEVDLGPDGGLAGGVCVADERVRNSSGAQVVGETPLYGSLYSTYQYLLKKWETDGVDEKQCRPYNIVLLTDGIEQTPAGFTVGGASVATSVQGLVGSFRNLSPGPKTRPDVKTYIIALGTGAAGNSQLTDVAQAGGTERAFDATDYNQLLTALQGIFTSMTAGRLSRSRPAIGTDGTRIYTTEFLKPSGSGDGGSSALDWSGYLSSFIISPLGDAPTLAWEHSAKLNNAAHPARTVVAALCNNPGAVRCSNADRVVVPFATSSPLLMNQLDDSPDFAAGADAGQVVTFLLNPGAPSGSGAPFLGSTALRTSRLGPISHSAPVVVGRSPYDREYGGSTEAQRSQYAAFQATTNGDGGRPTVVLVEGNDGMLHAVRERTGDPACSTSETGVGCPNGHEAWSLVPGSMKSKMLGVGQPNLVTQLFRLMQGGWSANYLNNTVSVADVCATGSGSANDCVASDWRTIAIVTMREGGRGMSAYDITSGAAPNTARFLWDYAEDDLGLTYSIPAIGRVSDGAEERFVAVFGGGVDDPATADVEGRRIYVLNAVNGQLIREYDKFLRGSTSVSLSEGVVARPSLHRRPGANFSFASSGFVAAGPSVLAMRFAKANGTLTTDSNQWLPQELFDPTSGRSARPATDTTVTTTPVRRVELVDAGSPDAGVAPSYQLVVDSSLPLPSAPPILARPRLAPVLVPSGDTIDLFVGTGDVRTPIDPASEFRNGNYFYAIHDFNLQDTSATENDGRAMWVVKFPKLGTAPAPERFEQVVSEPGIISGCVIVATYTTPTVATTCSGGGDARLYGFRPRDGELQPCLVYGAGPLAGQTTPVLDMPGSGIPSDLVCVGNSCYLKTERETTSGGGNLRQIGVRVPPKPGSVRSYRRIK
ncbi:MAG: hypothetical protein INH37_03980 [Myxococcaceae bacterium]|nr:hypothetical protein [Myxococcaceae bacterium]